METTSEALGAAWLGVLQGLTEFLPVSSSGHLVLFQQFIELAGDEVMFDLVLHVATLIPAMWFYRADIARAVADSLRPGPDYLQREGVRVALFVVIASIPTGLMGLFFQDVFESLFSNLLAVSIAFATTGVLLMSTRFAGTGRKDMSKVGWKTALLLGLAQGCAITPGISRSGTTIAVALWLGLRRELAVKLSFLMSIPAIMGAVLLKSVDIDPGAPMSTIQLGAGFFAAMITGYMALVWLVAIVKKGGLWSFSWYVWLASAVSMALFVFGAP